jgi:hypothetical protein
MDEDAYPHVSLLGMSTDEAADLIWSRLKTLAKLEGRLRAHDVSCFFRHNLMYMGTE